MNVAVFADVHGRIPLCFLLCARWERETGRPTPAAMGLLRWRSRDNNAFEVVEAPWLDEYNRRNWQASL